MKQEAVWRHRVNRVINYAHANFDQPIDLNELADVACLSKYHFSRMFTKECLETPLRYLWQLRLERAARKLVLEADRPVTDIAFASGFGSPQTFSKIFKSRFAASPVEFRREGERIKTQSSDVWSGTKPPFAAINVQMRPALRLAYIRNFGYGTSSRVNGAYKRLEAWAWRQDINPDTSALVGVCPDNPRFTLPQLYTYDAAIPVPAMVSEDETVSIREIPAGRYAVARVDAPYGQHLAIWEWLISEWLRDAGERYVQKWSYEYFLPAPERAYSNVSPTELCLRLEDTGSSSFNGAWL